MSKLNSAPKTMLRAILMATFALGLAGCLGYGSNTNNNANNDANNTSKSIPIPVEDRSTAASNNTSDSRANNREATPPSQTELSKNNVTLALLDKSAQARSQGNLKEAVTHVERAIRINPRRADLWVQLAQLQLALREPTIAEGYARKAISLAGTRLDWKRDAWLVIADAKQAQGLPGEAKSIRQRWRTAQG